MPTVEKLREQWFTQDTDHLLVSVDHNSGIVDQSSISEAFGGYVRHLKWGAHIPLVMGAQHTRESLDQQGAEIFYDLRLSYRWQQIAGAIINLNHLGFKRVSVGVAGAKEKGLEKGAVAAAQTGTILVASISSDNEASVARQIRKLQLVNGSLDEEQQIKWAMIESPDIAQVRDSLPSIILTATGIYLPGTTPDDIADRRTPEEARLAGADEIGIGNAITFPAAGMSSVQACQLALESWGPVKVE